MATGDAWSEIGATNDRNGESIVTPVVDYLLIVTLTIVVAVSTVALLVP